MISPQIVRKFTLSPTWKTSNTNGRHNATRYESAMIRSFRDPWTEAVFEGVQVSMLHPEISWAALRNLDAIDEAAALCD